MKMVKILPVGPTALLVSLLCGFVSLSCQGGGTDSLADKLAPRLIPGEWSFTSTVSPDNYCPCPGYPHCIGIILIHHDETFSVRISTDGATLTAVLETPCGDQPWAVGTVDGRFVTLQSSRDVGCTPDYTVHLLETDALSFDDGRLTGEAIVTVFGPAGSGSPVQLHGMIEGRRCDEYCGPIRQICICTTCGPG
jgi:hypothetical protein